MTRFSPIRLGRIALSVLSGFGILGAPAQPSLASGAATSTEESSAARGQAQVIHGARIDCITPDGRTIAVPSASEKHSTASALVTNDDTLRCLLQEGNTTFIISFLNTSLLDHFRFANENANVQGDMRIAVSNYQLPANSPKWTEVSGKTEFSSKRLFNLSMVGVEARFVKLSFHVEKGDQLASVGRFDSIVP